ncbi:MAG: ParB/RepB/Spo0J family partition protein [Deltaproteobacteria bacterium]|nr:ParB/RepB/Spo0J family partition protein [Deltaproteobacteria bacterium]
MAKRKALGKGLSALIPDADTLDAAQEQFFQCPVAAIEPNPYQPRQSFNPKELNELVASVKEQGIITPLLVSRTDAGYQLIAGERRWRAAQKAGLTRVPVVVREASSAQALELALIENIQREDLNPIEEAAAYGRLLEETGMTQEALARRLGRDRSSITNFLRLLKLPKDIREDVIAERLSMGHARLMAGLKSPGDQRRVRDAVIKKGLSVRQAEALVRKTKTGGAPKKRASSRDAYMESLSDDLKRSLGTKVEINRRGRRGRIIIHFYSDEELERLLDRLG